MKPIHLNLAARPYRDYRPVYAVVVVMSLLTAFLMLNNVDTYLRYVHETKSTRARIAQTEEQTRVEARKEQEAKDRLKGLDLVHLDQQTRFINAKLAQRSFSWSRLLDELESILADDVRLLSVSPTFNDDGDIRLTLNFQSKSSNGMITTINRMNAHPQFKDAFPTTESQDENSIFSFDLSVKYLPSSPSDAVITTAGVAR